MSTQQEQTHKLIPFEQEEKDKLEAESLKVYEKHNAVLRAVPVINEGKIEAELHLYKVVPIKETNGKESETKSNTKADKNS